MGGRVAAGIFPELDRNEVLFGGIEVVLIFPALNGFLDDGVLVHPGIIQ